MLCGANKKRGGSCGHPAGFGTDHRGTGRCSWHGGSTPSHRAHAQKELARQAVAAYGLPREIDPHAALLEEVHRTAGHVAALAVIVADLEQASVVQRAETVELPDGTRVSIEAAVNVWIGLYHAERKLLLRACQVAISCGVEERRVKLEEAKGALIASVFAQTFDDPEVGLSRDQRRAARIAAARHLRLIPGGQAA